MRADDPGNRYEAGESDSGLLMNVQLSIDLSAISPSMGRRRAQPVHRVSYVPGGPTSAPVKPFPRDPRPAASDALLPNDQATMHVLVEPAYADGLSAWQSGRSMLQMPT